MKSLFKEILFRAKNKTRFILAFSESYIIGNILSRKYKNVNCFCLFVGYGRSGHTLIASLLNAHPDIVIGIEWGVLIHQKLGYRKNQIFYSLIKNARNYSQNKLNSWTGYSYNVENSWQGAYKRLIVIGDKHGGTNSSLLRKDFNLLGRTETIIGIKPKIIHVIRNPFDIITTITIRRHEELNPDYKPTYLDLLPFIKSFFENAKVITRLKSEQYYQIHDLYHEEFVKNPQEQLLQLIKFLGLKSDDAYLNKCAAIVYKEPNKSRHKIPWPEEFIHFVEKEIIKYPFLQFYNFNN